MPLIAPPAGGCKINISVYSTDYKSALTGMVLSWRRFAIGAIALQCTDRQNNITVILQTRGDPSLRFASFRMTAPGRTGEGMRRGVLKNYVNLELLQLQNAAPHSLLYPQLHCHPER